jgi:3-methyl-2-oxobutanoate hydroxymethyltransferase
MHGKQPEEALQLMRDAKALAAAGAYSIVLECVPDELARKITEEIPIPTIGIGAGPWCDGQILVMHDLLGINPTCPKFVKRYAELGNAMKSAMSEYVAEVKERTFPLPRGS